jgi:hypothetical protein
MTKRSTDVKADGAAPLPWAMVPTGYWSLPVVHEAGHDAAMVVLTLLIDAGQWGAAKALPPECLRPRRLAVATGLAVRDGLSAAAATIEAALADALAAGLLVDDGGVVWFGPGLWVEREHVRKKLHADKIRRARSKADTGSDGEDIAGQRADSVRTTCKDVPHCSNTVQHRGEESREDKIPPVVPPGGTLAGGPATNGQIDPATMRDWSTLMGGGILRRLPEQALIDAWTKHPADIVRQSIAALIDWHHDNAGKRVNPRWLGERCARLAAARVEAQAVAQQPEHVAALVAAIRERCPMDHRTAGKIAALVADDSPAVTRRLAAKVEDVRNITSPAALVASMLPGVRGDVVADETAFQAQEARARREQAEAEAQAARIAAETPEDRERARVAFARMVEAL